MSFAIGDTPDELSAIGAVRFGTEIPGFSGASGGSIVREITAVVDGASDSVGAIGAIEFDVAFAGFSASSGGFTPRLGSNISAGATGLSGSVGAFTPQFSSVDGDVLLDFAAGQFNRLDTSVFLTPPDPHASYRTSFTSLAYSDTDVVAYENLPDAGVPMLLARRDRYNFINRNRDLTAGAWVKTGGTLVTGDATTGPDGTLTADQVAFSAAESDTIYWTTVAGTTPAVTDATAYTFSVWARSDTPGGAFRFDITDRANVETVGADVPIGTTWQRYFVVINSGTGAVALKVKLRNRAAGGSQSIYFTQPNLTLGRYPLSTITTDEGGVGFSTDSHCSEDVLVMWPAQVPARLRYGRWRQSIRPQWGSADLNSGDVRMLLSFSSITDPAVETNSGADDCLQFRHDGTGVLLEARVGGVTVATSSYVTCGRDDELRVIAAPSQGRLAVNEASGLPVAPWQWPAGKILRVGGQVGLTGTEFDGRLGAILDDRGGFVNPRLRGTSAHTNVTGGQLRAWSPHDLGSALKLWLRSDLGITLDGSGNIIAWADQSPSGDVLTSTGSAPPAWVATDANWGGRPSVLFGSATVVHDLTSGKAASFWDFLHDGSGCDVIVVHRPLTAGGASGTGRVLGTSGASNLRGFVLNHQGTNARHQAMVSDGTSYVISASAANATAPLDTNTVARVTHRTTDTPDLTLYQPIGTSRATGSHAVSGLDAANTFRLGANANNTGNPMHNSVAEIVVLNTVLSGSDLTKLTAYLTARNGVLS